MDGTHSYSAWSPDRWSYLDAHSGLGNMAFHEWSVNGSKDSPQPDSWLWFDATVVATINWDDIINGVFTNTCQCVSILSVEHGWISETDSFVQCRWAKLFRVDPAQKPHWHCDETAARKYRWILVGNIEGLVDNPRSSMLAEARDLDGVGQKHAL